MPWHLTTLHEHNGIGHCNAVAQALLCWPYSHYDKMRCPLPSDNSLSNIISMQHSSM